MRFLSHISLATRLSETEQETLPASHTPRYARAVRLATIPFVKAGWMAKNKGRWFITDEGKQACKRFPTALAFSDEASRIMAAWREGRSVLAMVTDEAEEKAWEQVKTYLQELKPYEFQVLVGDLLKAPGISPDLGGPAGKEWGIVDFIAHTDALGLNLPRIKVHVLHTGQQVMSRV